MAVQPKDLGLVSAYGAALEGGYTGTYDEYKTKMLELLNFNLSSLGSGYDDTELRNLVNGKMDKVNLAAVATSGSYNDLSNKPNIDSSWTLYRATEKPDQTTNPFGGGNFFADVPASLLEEYNEVYMFLITADFNLNELITNKNNLLNKGKSYNYNYSRYNLSYGYYIPTNVIKKGLESADRTSTGGTGYFVSGTPYTFSKVGEETIEGVRYSVNIIGTSKSDSAGIGITAGPAKNYFEEEKFNLRISFPDEIGLTYIYTSFESGTNNVNYGENCIVKRSSMRHGGRPGYAYLYVR